jgi:hypothetical protein
MLGVVQKSYIDEQSNVAMYNTYLLMELENIFQVDLRSKY